MNPMNDLPLHELFEALTRDGSLRAILELARREDLGDPAHDVTSEALIDPGFCAVAHLVCRETGVLAGLAALPAVRDVFAPDVALDLRASDGERTEPGVALATIEGPARQILAMERTALNLISRLSGVATRTAMFVAAANAARPDRPAQVCDTRKTTPGLRALEKYAVRAGGGRLHRAGLFDAMLIKDNHLCALGAHNDFHQLVGPIRATKSRGALCFVELEVETTAQVEAALRLEPGLIDIILLDNMSLDDMLRAVRARDDVASAVQLEASGSVTLDRIGAIARTGVDRISVGSLTHSAVSLDLALDFE